MYQAYERLSEIAEKMKDAVSNGLAPTPEEPTVRDFLRWYGYERRGAYIVGQIRNDLEELGLRTNPDFEGAYIDSTISIELDSDAPDSSPSGEPDSTIHRIGTLEAANRQPVSVKPDDPLIKATTIMQLKDYSRLPVMNSERDVKGIISWQSIGTCHSLGQQCKYVRDCMEEARDIPFNTPLFSAIEDIVEHGYVLVRQEDNIITGIVTAGDISNQFMQLAGPFLLIGEIESHLRRLAHGKFTVEQMRDASPEGQENIKGLADLTLGGYCRLFENKEHWEEMNLRIDRKEFVKHLNAVRNIRNDVMHFDPDGLTDEDIGKLKQLTQFFANLHRIGAV